MIIDKETNRLFLSSLLKEKYPEFHAQLSQKLNSIGVTANYLNNTKDIWCRDYMPIQKSDDVFVQFCFDPSYLKYKKYVSLKTTSKEVWEKMNLTVIESNVVLDGGNVVKWKNQVIITDRIIKDNPLMSEKGLFYTIKETLGIDRLIIIPELKGEITGHCDGILRFVGDNTVVINDFTKIDKKYSQRLKYCLLSAGLKYVELPNEFEQAENTIDDRGDYVNFLEMRDFVLIPAYGTGTDEVALNVYKRVFSGKTVESIECGEIAKKGGALNCITWNIKT